MAISDNQKRILILGSGPHSQNVFAFTWDKLPDDLNVANYDVVILNLIPLFNRKYLQHVDIAKLPSFQQFVRLLFSKDTELLAIGIGHPGFRLSEKPFRSLLWWFPLAPLFEMGQGATTEMKDPNFQFYFKYIKKWHSLIFHKQIHQNNSDETLMAVRKIVHPDTNEIARKIQPIAESRDGAYIAFEIRYAALQVFDRGRYGPGQKIPQDKNLRESGPIIWLPPTTEISVYDSINLILKERYGIIIDQSPPSWVNNYRLPRQVQLFFEITTYQQQIEAVKREMHAAIERLKRETYYTQLLYGQGTDILEPVVRDTFRVLGALVEDPTCNNEDGRMCDPSGRHFVIEIKGRTKTAKYDDVRQLNQWVDDIIHKEGKQTKGILVMNAYCNMPPSDRKTAFEDNCVKFAEQRDFCLLTSTQLFNALLLFQEEKLDITQFWDCLYHAKGMCSLPELSVRCENAPGEESQ